MPFSFDLPNPDSFALVPTRQADGSEGVAARMDVAAAIEATIQAQNDALTKVMMEIFNVIHEQLIAQQSALEASRRAIAARVADQLAGQHAAITSALEAVRGHVEGEIGRQTEMVGSTAVAAALLPTQAGAPLPPMQPPARSALSMTAPTLPWPQPQPPQPTYIPPDPLFVPLPKTFPGTGPGGLPWPTPPPGGDPAPMGGEAGCVTAAQAKLLPPDSPPVPICPETGLGGLGDVNTCPQGFRRTPSGHLVCITTDGSGGAGGTTDTTGGGGQVITVLGENEERGDPCPPPIVCPPGLFPGPPRPGEILDRASGCYRPAPPCPPPPPPPPPDGCPWNVTMKIPPIGGPEWCRLQGQIASGLNDLGQAIIDLVLGPIDRLAAGIAEPDVGAGLLGQIASAPTILLDIAKQLLGMVQGGARMVRQMIECWRELFRIAPSCDPKLVLGVAILRGIVSALKRMQIGTDLGVWVTVDLNFDFPQLERATTYIMESLCPSVIPDADRAWEAYAAGAIDEAAWRCWTLSAGQDPDLWLEARKAQGAPVKAAEVILYARLNGEPAQVVDTALANRGWTRDVDRHIVQALYDQPATPQQIWTWFVMGAGDDGVTSMLSRDAGFDAFWNGPDGRVLQARGVTETVAEFDYIAARPLPTLDEMKGYLYALRVAGPGYGEAVTVETVETILSASKMTPQQVYWAMATIWKPLAPLDVAQLIQTEDAQVEEMTLAFQNVGYAEADVKRMAASATAIAERQRALVDLGWSIDGASAIYRAYKTLPSDAWDALGRQGYGIAQVKRAARVAGLVGRANVTIRHRVEARNASGQAVKQAYELGTVTADQAKASMAIAGYDAPSAVATLAAIEVHLTTRLMKRAVNQIGRGLMKGELSLLQAQILLAQAGIGADRIERLSAAWSLERAATRPMARVIEIRRWVAAGLMSLATARVRLVNLGWANPDLATQLAEMQARLTKARNKAAEANARQQEAAFKEAEAIQAKAIRNLQRLRPVAALERWYKAGELSLDEVKARMAKYGYDEDSSNLYIQGWEFAKEQAQTKAERARGLGPMDPRKQVPLSQIRRWYIAGIVDEQWARDRLNAYGYGGDNIDRYIAEWDESGASQAPAPSANGNGVAAH